MGHFRRQKNVCYSKPPKAFQIYLSDIVTLWLDIMKLCCQFAMVAWSTVIPYCDSSVRRRDMTINTGMSMIRHLSDIKPSKCKRGQIKETQRFVRDKNGIRTSSQKMMSYVQLQKTLMTSGSCPRWVYGRASGVNLLKRLMTGWEGFCEHMLAPRITRTPDHIFQIGSYLDVGRRCQ